MLLNQPEVLQRIAEAALLSAQLQIRTNANFERCCVDLQGADLTDRRPDTEMASRIQAIFKIKDPVQLRMNHILFCIVIFIY